MKDDTHAALYFQAFIANNQFIHSPHSSALHWDW